MGRNHTDAECAAQFSDQQTRHGEGALHVGRAGAGFGRVNAFTQNLIFTE